MVSGETTLLDEVLYDGIDVLSDGMTELDVLAETMLLSRVEEEAISEVVYSLVAVEELALV